MYMKSNINKINLRSRSRNLDTNSNEIIDKHSNILGTCLKRHSKKLLSTCSKQLKIKDENFKILKPENYNNVIKFNYNVKQMKEICKHYKLKVSGTKNELVNRLYNYLRFTFFVSKIQKVWKNHLQKEVKRLRGPGYLNINKCVNDTDFLTMENLKDIAINKFISYSDNDGKIYGFDINSLYKLYQNNKEKDNIENPYTRSILPKLLKNNIDKLIIYSSFFNETIINNEEKEDISIEKKLELRAISLFQKIDLLGNLTNHMWYWNLGRISLVKFIRTALDIWVYRADLPIQIKKEICPPVGDPFRGIVQHNRLAIMPIDELREKSLNIIDNLISRGINDASKSLGANYVLCALTLVSYDAAMAYPWLYDSVAPI